METLARVLLRGAIVLGSKEIGHLDGEACFVIQGLSDENADPEGLKMGASSDLVLPAVWQFVC